MQLEHKFYIKSKQKQFYFQFLLILTGIILWVILSLPFVYLGFYLIPLFFIPIFISILAPFIDVPALVKNGKLHYYSPLFLIEKPHQAVIRIHGGSLFDYFFVLDKKMNARQRKGFILFSYLDGLDQMIETIKHQEDPPKIITATTYILHERTAQKIGFTSRKPRLIDRTLFYFNYFNLMLSASMAHTKIHFPRIGNLRTYCISTEDLCENQPYIRELKSHLTSTYKLPN